MGGFILEGKINNIYIYVSYRTHKFLKSLFPFLSGLYIPKEMAPAYPNLENWIYKPNTFHNKNTIHNKNYQEIKKTAEMSYKTSHLLEKD